MSSPGVRLTSIGAVVTLAVGAGTLAWSVLRILDSRSVDTLTASWLNIPWSLPIGLVLVAVGLGASARAWAQRRSGAPGTKPVDALAAARAVAAAKASAFVGSLVGGLYAGYLVFLLPNSESELRTDRLWASGATVLAAGLVVFAALALERVLQVHDDDDSSHRV